MPLIYKTMSPAVADFTCFEKTAPDDADLCVWLTSDQAAARGRSGVWWLAPSQAAAEYSIWLSYSQQLADLSVCYVATQDLAGWRRQHRLMNVL